MSETHAKTVTSYGVVGGKPVLDAICTCGWKSALYSTGNTPTTVRTARLCAESEHAAHAASMTIKGASA